MTRQSHFRTTSPRPHRRRATAVTLAALAAVLLSACGTTVSGAAVAGTTLPASTPAAPPASTDATSPTPSEQSTMSRPEPSTPASDEPLPPQPPEPSLPATSTQPAQTGLPSPVDDSATGAFGSTFTWDDGLAVSVSAPEKFTPNRYALHPGFDHYLKFDIVIDNASSREFDAMMMFFDLISGTAVGPSVIDSSAGVEGRMRDAVPAGESVEFTAAWGVLDPNDVVLAVRPGRDYDDVFYVSGRPAAGLDQIGAEIASSTSPRFGQAYQWPNGIAVSIQPGEEFTPDKYSTVEGAIEYRKFQVRVTNASGKPYDSFDVSIEATSNGLRLDRVYDGSWGRPSALVPHGRSIEFEMAYAIKAPGKIFVSVGVDYSMDPVAFSE